MRGRGEGGERDSFFWSLNKRDVTAHPKEIFLFVREDLGQLHANELGNLDEMNEFVKDTRSDPDEKIGKEP